MNTTHHAISSASHPFSIKVDHVVAGTSVVLSEFVNAGALGVVVFADVIAAADFFEKFVEGFVDSDDAVTISHDPAAFAGPVVDGSSVAVDLA